MVIAALIHWQTSSTFQTVIKIIDFFFIPVIVVSARFEELVSSHLCLKRAGISSFEIAFFLPTTTTLPFFGFLWVRRKSASVSQESFVSL
jgi:hypothetical protein